MPLSCSNRLRKAPHMSQQVTQAAFCPPPLPSPLGTHTSEGEYQHAYPLWKNALAYALSCHMACFHKHLQLTAKGVHDRISSEAAIPCARHGALLQGGPADH